MELDWELAEFFDVCGNWIFCASRGASFDPQAGTCIDGPCCGACLQSVALLEKDGEVLQMTDTGRSQQNKMNASDPPCDRKI